MGTGRRRGALWQLRDGEPEMMASASDRHASIQARLAQLIGMHLDAKWPPLFRCSPGGAWSPRPDVADVNGELRLDGIDFAAPLRDVYRKRGLV